MSTNKHPSQSSEPSSSLENPQTFHIKSHRGRSLRQFDEFLSSSTSLMDELFQFRRQLEELETARCQKVTHFQKICTEERGKSFERGPLPMIQYFDGLSAGQKPFPRLEGSIILDVKSSWRQRRMANIFKQG